VTGAAGESPPDPTFASIVAMGRNDSGERILQAAVDAIAERGLTHLRMEDVGKRVGMSQRIRELEEGGRRQMPTDLFFDRSWGGQPLDVAAVHADAEALQAVRMAPSATNRQPRRIVRDGAAWHFYLRRTKGYGKGSALFAVLRLADRRASTWASPCAASNCSPASWASMASGSCATRAVRCPSRTQSASDFGRGYGPVAAPQAPCKIAAA
jgi:hypothetical protein